MRSYASYAPCKWLRIAICRPLQQYKRYIVLACGLSETTEATI